MKTNAIRLMRMKMIVFASRTRARRAPALLSYRAFPVSTVRSSRLRHPACWGASLQIDILTQAEAALESRR